VLFDNGFFHVFQIIQCSCVQLTIRYLEVVDRHAIAGNQLLGGQQRSQHFEMLILLQEQALLRGYVTNTYDLSVENFFIAHHLLQLLVIQHLVRDVLLVLSKLFFHILHVYVRFEIRQTHEFKTLCESVEWHVVEIHVHQSVLRLFYVSRNYVFVVPHQRSAGIGNSQLSSLHISNESVDNDLLLKCA